MESKHTNSILSLAVETSGRLGSVALGRGPAVIEARSFSTALCHAAELVPVADALCRDNQVAPDAIDELYVSGGPGSFTGLRIGITFARTLALAHAVKVVRVPTLEAIARNVLKHDPRPQNVAVVLDAKRKCIYTARFSLADDRYVSQEEPREVVPDEYFATLPQDCALIGEGLAYHQEAVERAGLPVLPEGLNQARAEAVHHLGYERARRGEFADLAHLVPIYIRRPEAEEVWERRHGKTP